RAVSTHQPTTWARLDVGGIPALAGGLARTRLVAGPLRRFLAFPRHQGELHLAAGDVHGGDLDPDPIADGEGAIRAGKDEPLPLRVEAEASADRFDGDEAVHQELVDLGEEAEFGHAHDGRVEALADPLLHEEAFEVAIRLALGLHRRTLHLRGML